MIGRIGNRILEWVGARCRGRRLREGGRQWERLLRKIGKAGESATGCRVPSALWRHHGEAIYRQFKWDPAQVPAGAAVLCRQLLLLEGHLSELARRVRPARSHRSASSRRGTAGRRLPLPHPAVVCLTPFGA
jgi:hypothetical protein